MTEMWLAQNDNLVEVEQSHLQEEDFIENWIAQDSSILALDVMVTRHRPHAARPGPADVGTAGVVRAGERRPRGLRVAAQGDM